MAIVYRKTAKGVAEIETRAHRLTPRMRSALILVDGKRSDAELASMIQQQATETLHALAGQGFIEVLTIDTAPAPSAPPVVSAAAPPRPPAPTTAAAPAPAAPDLQARRREAVRAVNDLLGPAAESDPAPGTRAQRRRVARRLAGSRANHRRRPRPPGCRELCGALWRHLKVERAGTATSAPVRPAAASAPATVPCRSRRLAGSTAAPAGTAGWAQTRPRPSGRRRPWPHAAV